MKYFTGTYPFPFTWDQVVTSFWQKYSIQRSKHIESEDVISREIVGNKLVTKRLLCKSANSAWLVAQMLFRNKAKKTWVIEESIVDPLEKTMVTYTRNVGLKELAVIEEKCVYRVNPEKTEEVLQEKFAWIDSSYSRIGGLIQRLVYQAFKLRAGKSSNDHKAAISKLFYTPQDSSETSNMVPSLPAAKDNAFKEKAMRVSKMAHKAPKPPVIV